MTPTTKRDYARVVHLSFVELISNVLIEVPETLHLDEVAIKVRFFFPLTGSLSLL